MMESVELKVTLEEAVAIVNLLGSLPTSQGAHPLWLKLKAQVEPLLPKQEESRQ
jgi:hypothetical protein